MQYLTRVLLPCFSKRNHACLGFGVSLGFCAGLMLTPQASAMIVSEQTPTGSLGMGLSSFYLEDADGSRAQRYRLDILSLETLKDTWRWENHFAWAPDRTQDAEALDVRTHLYEWASSLRYNIPYFFRYGLSAGPFLRLEETITKVRADTNTQRTDHHLTLGYRGAFSMDYAFSPQWEMSFFLAFEHRPFAHKSDFLFGSTLLRNAL